MGSYTGAVPLRLPPPILKYSRVLKNSEEIETRKH